MTMRPAIESRRAGRLWLGWLGLPLVSLLACGGQSDGKGNGMTHADTSVGGAATGNTTSGAPGGSGQGAGGSGQGTGGTTAGDDGGMGSSGTGGVTASGGNGAGGSSGTGGANSDAGGGSSTSSTGGSSSGEAICGHGTYDTDPNDDELTCEEWSVCQPGTFQEELGNSLHDRICEPCPPGTFSDKTNVFSCRTWGRCIFGEETAVEPTNTSDRTCRAATSFPLHEMHSQSSTRSLVVTRSGAYLLVGEGHDLWNGSVLRYSLQGDNLDVWQLGQHLGDMVPIEEDIFVAGSRSVEDLDSAVLTEPGFLQKYTAEGALVWDRTLGDATVDHYSYVRVAARDGDLYVVARVDEYSCVVTEEGTQCEDSPAPRRTMLHVFDAEGVAKLSKVLENDSKVGGIIDVEVATDGHIYVALSRFPSAYGFDYPYIVEYDSAGVQTAEHSVRDWNEDWVRKMAADESGTGSVYVLSQSDNTSESPEYRLSALAANGQLLSSNVLDIEGSADMFTLDGDLAMMIGVSADGPQLIATDLSGALVSRDVLSDMHATTFTGLALSDDGGVYFSGVQNYAAFVKPWPQP